MNIQKNTLYKINILLIIFSTFLQGFNHSVLEENDHKLILKVEDESPIEWINSDQYPQDISAIRLGNSNSIDISATLSIPLWTMVIALPTIEKPDIQSNNIRRNIITLEKELTSGDIQTINSIPVIQIKDIGYSRFNPGGVLVINPIQVISPTQISIIRSMNISIRFPEWNQSYSRKTKPAITNAIQNSFVNKKYLREWQKVPEHKLAKPVEYPTGHWFKISVTENGIYKIGHQDLVNAGLSNQSYATTKIYLYSNATGGREIDNTPGIAVNPNLVENARLIEGGDNGYFDNGDNILFYGRATSGIDADKNGNLNFEQNAYSNVNYYWLLVADTDGSPKTIETVSPSTASADYSVATYEKLDHHELELTNFLRSGKAWYGEIFSGSGSSISLIFQIPEGSDENAELKLQARGAENETVHYFKLFLNSSTSPFASWSTPNWYVSSKTMNVSLKSGAPNIIKMAYTSSKASSQAYLDYMQLRYQAPLKPQNNELYFWGPANSGIIEYNISDIGLSDPVIWDITDWSDVSILDVSTQAKELKFRLYNDKSNRSHFLVTNAGKYKSPNQITIIDNPQWNTLRRPDISAQYIIITDETMRDAAEDLAKFHSEDVKSADRLSSIVALQSQILREFNADIVDPHAIRQFLTYAFNNWNTKTRKQIYVILLGDGTFDYRHIESESGDYVMTYQVEETTGSGNAGFASYTTDMRFTYVNGTDKRMDMAIGRINARSNTEAQAAVDKIRSYTLEPIYGDWHTRITLVADDPERPETLEKYHVSDTENSIVKYIPKTFNIKKLYLLEYPEVQDASSYGVKKPEATADLLKQIEDGTVIINYFGHGSPTVWAQEYILEMNRDMGRINTGMKLPFWIAGTCSWGQFDDISGSCFPEELVIEQNDGGIAALAASRATYGAYNASFVNGWITNLFNSKTANRIRIGEVLESISCSGSGINENNEKYILFGDPALYLALPTEAVTFQSLQSDTLKTLSGISVKGSVDKDNENFNGSGIIKLFDSDRQVTRYWTADNGTIQSMSYVLPGKLLFNGIITFNTDAFSSRFFIPKDLNYAGLSGKITVSGWNKNTGVEVAGYYAPVYYSGSETVIDTTGPEIRIGFSELVFKSGDVVNPESEFNISISDPLGVNIAGQMGHDISLVFDNDETMAYIATEYFTYDNNSDSSGSVVFPMPDLSPGEHSITVTAWDNANNSSEKTGIFTLLSSSKFAIERIVNFPNPFSSSTDITFQLTHPATIKCTIYTVRGLKVRTLETGEIYLPGFNAIYWNGEDDFGDKVAKGIYIYKIEAMASESDDKDSFIGKMVKSG